MDQDGVELSDLDLHELRNKARSIIYTGLRPSYKSDRRLVATLTRALNHCANIIREEKAK